jgi:hypothetical protein
LEFDNEMKGTGFTGCGKLGISVETGEKRPSCGFVLDFAVNVAPIPSKPQALKPAISPSGAKAHRSLVHRCTG